MSSTGYLLLGVVILTSAKVDAGRGFADTPQVITTVKALPSNQTVARGGVFDPDSGIEVTTNPAAISSALGPGLDSAAAADLKDLTDLATAAVNGLKAISKYSQEKPPRDTKPIHDSLVEVGQILDRYPSIRATVSSQISSHKGAIAQWQFIFQQATALADTIKAKLATEIPSVEVQLTLSRDNDLSRTPQVPLGSLPGQQSQQALANLMNSLNLSSTSGQVSPQDLEHALVTKYKDEVQTDYQNLKSQADALVSGFEAQAQSLGTTATDDVKKAWQPVSDAFTAVSSDWDNVKSAAEKLLQMAAATPLDFNGTVAQFNLLVGDISTLKSAVDTAKSALDTASNSPAMIVATASKSLQTLASTVQTQVTTLAGNVEADATQILSSAATLFGFVTDLTQIGQTYLNSTNGVATFHNSGNGLIGNDPTKPLPPMVSYDQLTIRIFAVVSSSSNALPQQIGEPYSIYAWKGGRFDSITAVGFFPRADSKHWGYSAIYGQAYKISAPNLSFNQLRLLVPGFGFTVETLDQEGNGQQSIGVGAMVTFFDDRLIGGYGYDTTGKGGYWYFGYRFKL